MAYMSAKAMDFSLPEAGLPLDTLVADCRAALRYQVKTGHPHFFNQLSQVIDTNSNTKFATIDHSRHVMINICVSN